MNNFEEFLMDTFEDAEEIERVVSIGGKERLIKLKSIGATLGDEIRKRCKKVKIYKGQRITEMDEVKYMSNLIIETVTVPDFKNAQLQSAWGVVGAEELLSAMKTKMKDGEYSELSSIVSEINGYDKGIEELVEEAKN